MRALSLILVVLFALIQYPLWLGKGGWLRVLELDRQLNIARQTNFRMEVKNQALEGEVRDLKQGLLAIEERARYELGMVRADELFIQINAIPKAPVPPVRRDGLGLGNDVPPLASVLPANNGQDTNGAGPIRAPE
jgi:cell division protein FtsB